MKNLTKSQKITLLFMLTQHDYMFGFISEPLFYHQFKRLLKIKQSLN